MPVSVLKLIAIAMWCANPQTGSDAFVKNTQEKQTACRAAVQSCLENPATDTDAEMKACYHQGVQ